MKLEHLTGMEAGYTMGLRPDGRELLVVCVKGTFTIPENGETPQLSEKQVPLVEADVFNGEPGYSTLLYESDYAPIKKRCDVLLNGSAYAPGGRHTQRVPVSLQVGSILKTFNVVGNRNWERGLLSVDKTPPVPFRIMPFSYDSAFGGTDQSHENPDKHKIYSDNPSGTGYHYYLKSSGIDGKPLPNTEELNRPIKNPGGTYRPMAFGSIPRSWPQRIKHAGTYDQSWRDNIFPFLPPDFDTTYFQSAPKDQQMPYPEKEEPVVLGNLTPDGQRVFSLPRINLVAWFFMASGEEIARPMLTDTILIEPDQDRLMVTCRTSLPLKKDMFEVEMVVLGASPEDRETILKAVEPTWGDVDEPVQTDE